MTTPLIRAEKLHKKFAIQQAAARRYGVRDFLRIATGIRRPNRLRKGEFWALKDVSFEVAPGESLAVLGRNGAGKSTLLSLMTGRMLPDHGSLSVKGRVGVLALGQFGFRSNLTGHDNIIQKGIALGLRKKEIEALTPDIIEFADIGDFINAPMRTYSSGMTARLGFAVAVNVQPDILLADEALSAGDAAFAQKCSNTIAEMRKRMTFVIVTHNASFAAKLCARGIVLDKGAIVFNGPAQEAATFYKDEIARSQVTTVSA